MSNNKQNTRQFRLTRSTMGLDEQHEHACDEEANAAATDSLTSSLGIVVAPCSTQQQVELSGGSTAYGCGVNTGGGGGGGCGVGPVSSDDNNEAVGSYSTTEILMQRSMHSVTYKTTMPADSSAEVSETCLCESAKPVTQCITSTVAMPTAHYRTQLEKYRNEVALSGGDAAQINFELNGIFLKRLEDIDCQSDGDLNLRLVTYQEWVDLLLHINNVIFGNISQMETEAAKRIRECFCKLNCDQEQSQDENRKLRKDICSLIKIIQSAYHKNCWNFNGLNFETLSVQQVLGIPRHQCPENRDGGDMDQHMKALACEVAQKYDDICLLRSQIICLESDIQTAHQKIIFKDETIACLREKLEQLEEELDRQQNKMPTNDACCKVTATQHQKLFETDNFECEFHQILEDEFQNAFEQNSENKYQSLELHRKRLGCLFQRISEDRNSAYNKLNCLRNQLSDLESERSDTQNASGQTSADELDPDGKLVEQIRKRFNCLNNSNKAASLKSQKLEIELNDLQTNYNSAKCINDINCRILKELADLISGITGRAFTYEESYSETTKRNPFSEAFLELYNNYETKQTNSSELHDEADDCPHRKQLENTLRACHDQSAVMAATRENYLNIIDELKHDLDELTLEVAQQQQQQCNLESSFENEPSTGPTTLTGTKDLAMPPTSAPVPAFGLEHAMYALAAHNERLQQALLDKCNASDMTRINTLEKHNAELTCHVQHLTEELRVRDSHITQLNSTINGQSAYCERMKLQEDLNGTRQELSDSKQKICDLSRGLRDASSMLQSQKNAHLEMCSKYERLQCIYDEQGNQLKSACLRMQSLQDCFKDLEKRQDELKMERNLLRDEVMGLKEKEACLLGREKSLSDRLRNAECDIIKARNLAREMQAMMQREDEAHKNSVVGMHAANEEYKRKLCDFSIECKNMQTELKQQVAINDQREKIIESYKKWQADQIKSDEITRKSIRGAEKHVQLLLEQNQQLMEDNQSLIFDSDTLQRELQRLRQCIKGLPGQRQTGGSDVTAEEAIASRFRYLYDTTRRLAEHQRTLTASVVPDEDDDADVYRDNENNDDAANKRETTAL